MFLSSLTFIAAILLGVLIYWRESRSNGIFRAYNAFINKKETRMEASDRKGFFYQRPIVYRVINALLLAVVIGIITYYLPFLNNHLLEIALASFVGIIAGSYLAAALPTVKRAVDNPLDALQDVGNAGKEIISDLSETAASKIKEHKTEKKAPPTEEKNITPEEPKKETAD
jgi:hypothetical protein